MRTLVTGGAGFIGSHLVGRLLEDGREVTIADDFSRGSVRNLTNLGIHIACDKIDLRDYDQALKSIAGAESVFHLAARIGSLEYLHGSQINELAALQSNLAIDANVFRACRETGNVRRLVYASSIAVYPMNRQLTSGTVLSENDLTDIDPDGGYGWAKLMGEIQLGWMENIDIGIARIFNVYGENSMIRESPHVVADLIRKTITASSGELLVWGDGKQSRDFLHVSDCVEALVRLEQSASNPPLVVNVGSGQETSISTIAETVVAVSGKGLSIRYDPAKPVGPISRTANMGRAKSRLEWQPSIGIEEGLKRMYEWVEREIGASP